MLILTTLKEEGVQIVPEIDPRAQSDFISSRSVTELVEQEEEEDHMYFFNPLISYNYQY